MAKKSDEQHEDLRRWVYARSDDVLQREYEHSLRVGPGKPLGSRGYAGGFWGWYMMACDLVGARGPGVVLLCDQDEHGHRWIYAWHRTSLETLLRFDMRHRGALSAAGWPCDCRGFIQRSRAELVPPLTPLYDLIADCYGDKLNPGRTDVLPGVPREKLLEAHIEIMGCADPASIYFHPVLGTT